MPHQFHQHYTVEEARDLLPQVRTWLAQLQQFRQQLQLLDERIGQTLAGGYDAGGESVNAMVRLLAQSSVILKEFSSREIQIKDMDRGLIDFPAIMGGREVFLCWEQDEDDIEFWHELDSGYAGRERL